MVISIDSVVKILSSFPTSAVPAALIRNVNKVYLFQKMHRGALETPDTITKQSQAIQKKIKYLQQFWVNNETGGRGYKKK